MQIQAVPANKAMTEQELIDRYSNGWVFGGTFGVARGPAIAVPGKDDAAPVIVCHIWVRAEPMIPVRSIVGTLMALTQENNDLDTLNNVAEALTGQDLNQLAAQMTMGGKQ